MRFSIRFIRRSRRARQQTSINIADELARQGRWLAWVSQETAQGVKRRLYLDPRKWLRLGAVLVVLGYVGGGVALHAWLDRRPHNQVTLADLMLPWRWPGVPAKRAEGYALRGMAALEAGETQTGIFMLQRSLAGQPDNNAARLALAEFYQRNRYYDGVRRTVLPQLDHGASRPLLQLLFEAAMGVDDLDAVLSASDTVLAGANLAPETRWVVEKWRARALVREERYAEALDLLEGPNLREDREVAVLALEALLAEGHTEEARAVTTRFALNDLEAVPVPLVLRARFQRETGDGAGLRATLTELLNRRSGVPLAWIHAAGEAARFGDDAQALETVRGYLARWGATPAAVRQLLAAMVDTGNATVALGTFEEAQLYQTLTVDDRLGVALTQIERADWPAVAASLAWVESRAVGEGEPPPSWLPWIERVLETAREPAGREDLVSLVGGLRLPPAMHRVLLNGFERSGDLATVARLTELAVRQNPQSWQLARWQQWVADWQSSGRIKTVDTASARRSRVEAAMRREVVGLPVDAPALRAELAAGLAAERWEETGELMRRVRRVRPDWLREVADDLAEGEARVAAGAKDWLAVRQLAPGLLRRDPAKWGDWLMDQVEVIAAEGKPELARGLAEAVQRHPPAQGRAAAWLQAQDAPAAAGSEPAPE